LNIPSPILANPLSYFPLAQTISAANGFLDLLPVGICVCDAEGRIVQYNRRAAELWGQMPDTTIEATLYCGSLKAYRPNGETLPPTASAIAEVLRTGQPLRDREIVFEREDSSRVNVLANANPLLDSNGQLIGAVNCFQDITALISERNAAEERQKTLVNELNHRVKNMLATVQALAAQAMRGDGSAKDERDTFVARLFALSRAHDRLTRENWQSADLRAIIEEIMTPYHGRTDLDGNTVRLAPKMALSLTMVLHELAANAARFGSLSVLEGHVALSWIAEQREDGPHLVIGWRESSGPKVTPPARKGFGMRLIERSVAQELGGKVEFHFEPLGLRANLDVPLV